MADRKEPGRLDGLLEGEEIVAMLSVRYSAGMQTEVESTATPTMFRPSVVQRHAYAYWSRRSASAGFPIAGPEMVLGVTPERLLVWRPGPLRGRPKRFAGALPLSRIQSAGVHRRVFATVLTMLMDQGTIVGVESLRGSRLRAFAATIPTFNDHRAR